MEHPDNHNGLDDWPTYGPRDPEIARLVCRLAHEKGMRLAAIEDLLKAVLLQNLDPKDGSNAEL